MNRLLARIITPRPTVALRSALLRLACGAIFVVFGLGKFTDHGSESASFATYGLPSPSLFAYAIGGLELAAGLLLLAGLATRLAAPALAGDMVGAIATAGPVEGGAINLGLAPTLAVVLVFLTWGGAGRWSLDERIGRALRAQFDLQQPPSPA